jgi:hypothetical protein
MDKILDKMFSKKFGVIFLTIWLLNGLAEKYESHATICIWMIFSLTLIYCAWQAWWDWHNYRKDWSDDQLIK